MNLAYAMNTIKTVTVRKRAIYDGEKMQKDRRQKKKKEDTLYEDKRDNV